MAEQVRGAREVFGSRLREIRKEGGLSGRELAVAVGMHFTKVSRLEHGKQNPSESDVREWCVACGAERQIPELVATLRGIEGMWVEWQRHLRGGLKHLQQTFDRFHEQASVVRSYEPTVIPGILQTAQYSAAGMRIANDFYRADGRIDDAVAVRAARQRFLYRSSQCFLFVIEFWALVTRFGGVEVMRAQLERLLGVTELPNVSFGVIRPVAEEDDIDDYTPFEEVHE